MATSLESPSPHKRSRSSMGCSPPMFSPSSDKRYWSTLRSRVDTLLQYQRPQMNAEAGDHAKRLKEDSMLLLRGFDSVAQSLSHLSNNLETALEGAKTLAKSPTLAEIVHATTLERAKDEEESVKEESKGEEKQVEDDNRGLKRKLDSGECSDDQGEANSQEEKRKGSNEMKKIKKAKNLAIAMATRAASMARELKSIRSDMAFMQERCGLLEEENRKLRDGSAEGGGVRPDDDDLVRLQLEALLAEKSRLASENANLTRENQCLHQLVEYHQLTSQDLSASYDNLMRGMCLDFSSPREADEDEDGVLYREFKTPHADISGFSKSLDQCFDEEEEE